MRRSRPRDADARLVRRAAVRVAGTITSAVSALVIVVLIAAYSTVFSQIPLPSLLNPQRQETSVDIGGLEIVVGGAVIGVTAIIAAAVLALLVTRRAVRPLTDALRRQRQFVADASHELRTPLAVLDARLQLLQRTLEPGSTHRETVALLREDSKMMISTVTDLLDALEIDDKGEVSTVIVADVIDSVTAAMQVLADQRGIRIYARSSAKVTSAAMPPRALGRCLTALMDNALKHSPDNGVVVMNAEKSGSTVRILVEDHGGGIQGIDPDRVFHRFARSSEARGGGGNSHSSFGIGLALVHDTMSRYGGQALVAGTSSEGTSMELIIPVGSERRRRRGRIRELLAPS